MNKENWNQDIKQLEEFYSSDNIPKHPVRIDAGCVVNNPEKLFETHLPIVKANNGRIRYRQYLVRLQKVRNVVN